MAQISYTNKVALNENPEILDINKVTDDDMNEIKQVVNDNYNNTIQITDTEPTDTDNKIWIDTGEVQSIGSEVSVGTTQPTNGEKVWFKTSKNLFDYSKSINGYISATGEFNTSNTNMLSDYIETESNKQYIASTYTNVYGINIAEFDSSKAFIKRTMSLSNVKENSITTSSTTKYIRVWFNIDNSTTMNINSLTNIKAQILYGDIATTYEPYINKQIYTNQNGYYNYFSEIESGSNENGNWIKFADGTMVCSFIQEVRTALQTSYGSLYRSTAITLHDFPLPFTQIPVVNISISNYASFIISGGDNSTTAPMKIMIASATNETTQTFKINVIAIGRWK